jgi:hypothetical protein
MAIAADGPARSASPAEASSTALRVSRIFTGETSQSG